MQLAGSNFELKSLDDSGAIEGILAGFGNVDHGGDVLVAGCLSKSLAGRRTPLSMLRDHDPRKVIGAWHSWREEPDGLFVSGKMSLAVPAAQEAHILCRDGGLRGLSIGWLPQKTKAGPDGTRVVVEAEIFEGSLVAMPMNPNCRVVEVKEYATAQDIAELLHAGGMRSRQAKVAAGAAWKAINQQPDEAEAMDEVRRLFDEHSARLAALGGR